MKNVRGMVALWVALSVVGSSSALLAQKAEQKEVKRTKAEQVDIDALLKAADGAQGGQVADSLLTWESNHFLRSGDGPTYVPFTVKLDRSKLAGQTVAVYVRVDPKGTPAPTGKKEKDKPAHSFENVYFATVSPAGTVSRAFQVKGGDYDVYVAVKDKGTVEKADKNFNPTVGMLKKQLSVPDYTVAELKTSTVILATAIQQAPAGVTGAEDPYVFGAMQIVPSVDAKYKKSDTLELIYWIYGMQVDAAGKPDITIENAFNQKTAEGEKFFNKTQPQSLNAQTLPPNFSAALPVPGSLQVPLASFPVGDYRLEIKITDKMSGKSITENVAFSVS